MEKKKLIKTVIIILIAALLFTFYLYRTTLVVMQTDMDADYSFELLEANDIIHGNFFLKGWTQTGISFLFTDLLYFMVGAAVFGAIPRAYVIAVTLMAAATFVSGYFLLGKKNLRSTVLYVAITAFPTVAASSIHRGHAGGYVWAFISFAFVMHCFKRYNEQKKMDILSLVVIGILTAMCSMSDMAAFIFGGGAILIVCVYKLIFDAKADKKFYGELALSVFIGAVAGVIADKLYYVVGGAVKNDIVTSKCYVSIYDIWDKLCVYVDAVFTLGSAHIWNKAIMSPLTMVCLLHAAFVVLGIVLMIRSIVLFLQHRSDDLISVCISIGFVVISLLFIFTNIGIDSYSARYFGALNYMLAVVVVRWLEEEQYFEKFIYTSKIKWKQLMAVLSVLLLIGGFFTNVRETTGSRYVTEQEELALFLQEQGLTDGYAPYYESSVAEVVTDGEVHLSQVILDGTSSIYPYYWFCREENYSRPVHFIVCSPDDADFNMTEEEVTKALGKPDKVLTFGKYAIYEYNEDLSERIKLEDLVYSSKG
jgi:hypothetical protein